MLINHRQPCSGAMWAQHHVWFNRVRKRNQLGLSKCGGIQNTSTSNTWNTRYSCKEVVRLTITTQPLSYSADSPESSCFKPNSWRTITTKKLFIFNFKNLIHYKKKKIIWRYISQGYYVLFVLIFWQVRLTLELIDWFACLDHA